jgi:hypothetical protein
MIAVVQVARRSKALLALPSQAGMGRPIPARPQPAHECQPELLLKGVASVICLFGREMCTAIGQVTPDIGDGPAPSLPINFVQQMQGGPFFKHQS